MKKISKKEVKQKSAAGSKRNSQSRYAQKNKARIRKAVTLKKKAKKEGRVMMSAEGSLKLYLDEIGKIPVLKAKEEKELFKKFIKWRDTKASKSCGSYTRKKGREAREKLIESNLRLVVTIAGDYRHCNVPFEELINEANIGLMRAVDKFQLDKGVKLSTYAQYWIRQSILRLLASDARTIRMPTHARDAYYRVLKFKDEFSDTHGREPTKEETVKGAKCSKTMLHNLMESGVMNIVSLNAQLPDSDGGGYRSDLESITPDFNGVAPDEKTQQTEDIDILERFLKTLSRREKYILIYRFGLDGKESETLEKIGKRYGISRERIRQVQEMALDKLKSLNFHYYKRKPYVQANEI